MKILKSHEFWIGLIVALLLVGLFPQFNVVSKLKSGSKGQGSMGI